MKISSKIKIRFDGDYNDFTKTTFVTNRKYLRNSEPYVT